MFWFELLVRFAVVLREGLYLLLMVISLLWNFVKVFVRICLRLSSSMSQFSLSSIYLTLDVRLWRLSAHLAARLCKASRALTFLVVWGSQTAQAYSRMGRTIILYAVDLALLDVILLRLRNPRVLLALFVLFSMWVSQVAFDESVTPRYLACSTLSNSWPCSE